MKTALLSILVLMFAITDSPAQYYTSHNKVWVLGWKAGIDFTSGVPVSINTALINASHTEGRACVSDTSGHLLFYTDGKKVYSRNNTLMPSGANIVSYNTRSATQGALIVPVIGSSGRYYLFSLEEANGASSASDLSYSIVDMALNGGYGDVVTGSMEKHLEDSMSEKMIAITGNDHNIWLLTHRRDTTIFLAYNITSTGIDTVPVVSPVGTRSSPHGYTIGVIKASPNRRKIATQTWDYFGCRFGTELYDFDPATGIVSNCIMLDTAIRQYGAEFSPDNTKLYTQQSPADDTMQICQYNLAAGSPAAIRLSKTLIASITSWTNTDLKLAPDYKIYFTGRDDSTHGFGTPFSRYLDCISSPNALGASCGYVSHAFKFPDTTGAQAGLPNLFVTEDTGFVSVGIDDVASLWDFSLFPNPATTQLTIAAPATISSVTISNLLGLEVLHHEYNGEMIKVDISTLTPGIYFIKVNGTAVKKFIKQ